MTLYKNKYRIESIRLKDWDYSRDGCYFVTICTQDKECIFGDVINEKVQLSAIGEIVADEWLKTPQIRKNVSLDTWIIMPNHLHGIVIINSDGLPVETHCSASQNGTAHNAPHSKTHSSAGFKETHSSAGFKETHSSAGFKETHSSASLPYKNKFGPQANNLSSIIRGFKSASTTRIRIAGFSFSWQPRFYDHIIRNEKKLNKIREYIINNPLKWELDKNNPANLFM